MTSSFRTPQGVIVDQPTDIPVHGYREAAAGAAEPAMRREGISYGDALRSVGPKYPPHDANAPILTGIDIVGLVAATVITLGPLAAYSLGLGA